MGLEAKQTRASRDGGVDCIAYDTRPIFGGKVVIQAKRYKNTVGVSAVRDLFGTLQNEGASKGILVTTSSPGPRRRRRRRCCGQGGWPVLHG
ncbi:restriction endonuclease [Mycobacterium asiaticum]|uniref:restriction endonuclease n=1 Tax=Mycobacterium asiaticum TaxID=1790 RepID=UPI001F375485|nr:restriction endonuclease [Mycobacterium asiaticum]